MAPRTLASLAHSLSAAGDLDAAFVAFTEALAELDRLARLYLVKYDGRRKLLRERLAVNGEGTVDRQALRTSLDHFPGKHRAAVVRGGAFVDFGEESEQFARLLDITDAVEDGLLALRGLTADGTLSAVLVLYEPRRIFGTRLVERFGPYAAVFDLAFARFADRDARDEAVNTLEGVMQQVHGEYLRKLGELEQQLVLAQGEASRVAPEQLLALERAAEARREEARRATHKVAALEQQVGAAVEQLERAHIELHRRSEMLRQKSRSLYLIDRVLTLDAGTAEPRALVEGLVALLGDDMQAQRCSIMLRSREPEQLYLAAARGLPPEVVQGLTVRFGQGVAGTVAATRKPLLVRDVADAVSHPLLKDQYFTTGSFISFPLVYHDELLGVVNLTNRVQRGLFLEEDVERVRLLALLVSVIVSVARLPERLLEAMRVPG
jgi:putative methionine-R-sulfoxide reductase with GAF domain